MGLGVDFVFPLSQQEQQQQQQQEPTKNLLDLTVLEVCNLLNRLPLQNKDQVITVRVTFILVTFVLVTNVLPLEAYNLVITDPILTKYWTIFL